MKLDPRLPCFGVHRYEMGIVVGESWNPSAESPKNTVKQGSLPVTVRSNHNDGIGIKVECVLLREATESTDVD